jgi:hypothetical protein
MTAPFCAVIVVGIDNAAATAFLAVTVTRLARPLTRRMTRLRTVTVLVLAHRLRTPGLSVVSTPCGPCGNVKSKLDTGASRANCKRHPKQADNTLQYRTVKRKLWPPRRATASGSSPTPDQPPGAPRFQHSHLLALVTQPVSIRFLLVSRA